MKRLLTIYFFLFTASVAWAQTTRIANNNPGATPGVNVYTGAAALQNAINASASGDIIHIVAGSTSNGDVNILDKSLTLLGVGLNPQKGLGTRSLVGNMTINGAAASGTRLSGLHLLRLTLANNFSVVHTVANVLVENCQLSSVTTVINNNSIGNLIVRNSVIISHPGFSNAPSIEIHNNSGVLFTNNIIRGSAPSSASTISGDGLTLQNNIIYGNGSGYVFTDLDNSIVQNNIFARISPAVGPSVNNTGNTFVNNIVFGSADNTFTNGTAGNTATGNLIADPLLTNLPSTTGDWIYTYDITLLTGSPAINAGQDGTNIGPTGGLVPFDKEGTLLPLIESINMPAIVTKGVNLQVNVKAKGN